MNRLLTKSRSGSTELRALASETGLMAGPRRSPKPALVCHWYLIGDEGRLECRWQAEANDATPIDDLAQAVCIENLIRVDDVTEGPAREIPARPRDHSPLGRDYFESTIGLFRPIPAPIFGFIGD